MIKSCERSSKVEFDHFDHDHFDHNRVDVGSYPQHLSLHRTYGSRIRRYIHIGERKL